MFCPKCGEKIQLEDSRFCSMCGFDFNNLPKKPQLDNLTITNNNSEISKSDEIKPLIINENDEEKSEALKNESSKNLIKPLPSSLKNFSLSKESLFDRLKERWGAGWLFFGWLFYSPHTSKYYKSLSSDIALNNAIQLLSFILCMIVYYYSRKLLSVKIERSWIRSTLAVLIAYAIYFLLSIFLYLFILKPQSNISSLSQNNINQETSSWKLHNLTNANLIIESPFDLNEESVQIPKEAKDLIQKSILYSYSNNAFKVNIGYTEYKKGIVVNLDNYKSVLTNAYNKSKDVSDFEFNLTKTTKDNLDGRMVKGYVTINNIKLKIWGVVYNSGLKIWQIICSYSTPEYENIIQGMINSFQVQDKSLLQNSSKDTNVSKIDNNSIPNNIGYKNVKQVSHYSDEELKNNVFIKTETDNPAPKINETFIVKFVLYTRLNISSPIITLLPTFLGLNKKELADNNIKFELIKYNGENFRAAIISKYELRAEKKGTYIITPYGLSVPIVVNKGHKYYQNFDVKSEKYKIDIL